MDPNQPLLPLVEGTNHDWGNCDLVASAWHSRIRCMTLQVKHELMIDELAFFTATVKFKYAVFGVTKMFIGDWRFPLPPTAMLSVCTFLTRVPVKDQWLWYPDVNMSGPCPVLPHDIGHFMYGEFMAESPGLDPLVTEDIHRLDVQQEALEYALYHLQLRLDHMKRRCRTWNIVCERMGRLLGCGAEGPEPEVQQRQRMPSGTPAVCIRAQAPFEYDDEYFTLKRKEFRVRQGCMRAQCQHAGLLDSVSFWDAEVKHDIKTFGVTKMLIGQWRDPLPPLAMRIICHFIAKVPEKDVWQWYPIVQISRLGPVLPHDPGHYMHHMIMAVVPGFTPSINETIQRLDDKYESLLELSHHLRGRWNISLRRYRTWCLISERMGLLLGFDVLYTQVGNYPQSRGGYRLW